MGQRSRQCAEFSGDPPLPVAWLTPATSHRVIFLPGYALASDGEGRGRNPKSEIRRPRSQSFRALVLRSGVRTATGPRSQHPGPQNGVGIMATPLSLRPAARRDGARSGPPAEATGASVSCSEGAECGTGCGPRISGLRAGGGASFLLPSTFYLLPSTLAHASLSVMVRLKTRRPGALSSSSAK